MRLASTEFFSISKTVVRKMLNNCSGYNGTVYTWQQANTEFNNLLTTVKQPTVPPVVLTQETAYSSDFGEHGIPAASALMNTLRQGNDCNISIGYSPILSAPIFEGDYSKQQLTWLLTTKTAGHTAEYTGAEIKSYMEWLINVKEDGSNPVRNYYVLPVTSGMEYTVKDEGNGRFTLTDLTINGEPLDQETVYKVMLLGDDSYITDPTYCNCPMPQDLKAKRTALSGNNIDILLRALQTIEELFGAKQFMKSCEYVTIT